MGNIFPPSPVLPASDTKRKQLSSWDYFTLIWETFNWKSTSVLRWLIKICKIQETSIQTALRKLINKKTINQPSQNRNKTKKNPYTKNTKKTASFSHSFTNLLFGCCCSWRHFQGLGWRLLLFIPLFKTWPHL